MSGDDPDEDERGGEKQGRGLGHGEVAAETQRHSAGATGTRRWFGALGSRTFPALVSKLFPPPKPQALAF